METVAGYWALFEEKGATSWIQKARRRPLHPATHTHTHTYIPNESDMGKLNCFALLFSPSIYRNPRVPESHPYESHEKKIYRSPPTVRLCTQRSVAPPIKRPKGSTCVTCSTATPSEPPPNLPLVGSNVPVDGRAFFIPCSATNGKCRV